MIDTATRYLQLLQTGYRIDEYSITATGTGIPLTVCPSNPNRVLLFLNSDFTSSDYLYFKMQSGLLVLFRNYQDLTPSLFTTAMHYSLPSLEVVTSNQSLGQVINGFGIVKQ